MLAIIILKGEKMVVGGICQSCKKYSIALFKCHGCGTLVCPLCVIEGTPFCKLCQGKKMVK